MLLEAPIGFDVPGRVVHSPMVSAVVGGVRTRLILDTAASDHVLTIALARRAGLPTRAAAAGTDHAGAAVPSWTLGPTDLVVAGRRFDLSESLAIEGPPPFEHWAVGGFLSPQRLHPTAYAVLDLRGNRFFLVEGAPADVSSWAAKRWPGLSPWVLPRLPAGALARVAAAIEPFAPVAADLNTGGAETEFCASAVPQLSLIDAEANGRGVSGARVEGGHAGSQLLRVGGARRTVPRLFVRATMEPAGLIGMDALRGTVLGISGDPQRPVIWLTPR